MSEALEMYVHWLRTYLYHITNHNCNPTTCPSAIEMLSNAKGWEYELSSRD